MQIKTADKMQAFETGIFSVLNDKRKEIEASGKKVFNLSIGTPDFKPFPHIMKTVSDACLNPDNYKYSITETDELLDALVYRYDKRYGVAIEKDEILAVYGSQEGMAHIFQPFVNPGDIVLVPNPGYPIFSIGAFLAQSQLWEYPLLEENEYLPDFQAIPEDVRKAAKVMVVSYPANPLCVTAPDSFYEELIRFAKENDIMIIHDNAYSDIVYDGKPGKSFLSFEGAKEVGVEFYSLSKSFNYTGARMSFVIGNADVIRAFRRFRSQIDYGIFYPIQMGAVDALTNDYSKEIEEQCAQYQKRRDALCEGLDSVGWHIPKSQGTMFAWGKIPEGWDDDVAFVMELMEKTGLICTPGSSFGSLGKGYVRFALVLPPEVIAEAVEVIRESGIFEK